MGTGSAPQLVSFSISKNKEEAVNEYTDLEFTAESVNVAAGTNKEVSVRVTEASVSDVLACFDPQKAIEHYGANVLIDLIGKEKCKKYFSLTEAE